eukprot:g5273.t1
MLKPSGFRKYFTTEKDPKDLIRKWQTVIRKEVRQIERQLRDINREKKKAESSVREAAKRQDMTSARILAKEIVQTNRTVTQLYANKAHMVAMQTALTEQLAVARVSGTLEKSTEVMTAMSDIIKIPELMKITQNLAREMEKAGVIEEMISEAVDDAIETEDLEEDTEIEVEKILSEITGEIKSLPTASGPQRVGAIQEPVSEEVENEMTEEDASLQARLNAMRS